jgi:predicted dienelactone hydrolase
MNKVLPRFLSALLALLGASAQASVGVTQLAAVPGDGPVVVFYPSSDEAKPIQRGPFAFTLAAQGTPVQGNRRLIVISHGSGGSPWVHADLAQRLVQAGFIVALPEHQGDNWKDMSKIGPESWKQRPAEVSRAIDALGKDARFAPLLALDRVGMYGMSAGGHTALSLAGGRWSPSALLKHCQAHLEDDFNTCAGPATQLNGGFMDGVKKMLVRLFNRGGLDDSNWYSYVDPRIQAIVAAVPFSVDFDLQSLAAPRVPLGIVQADQDKWLTPRFHSNALLAACSSCVVVVRLPNAGHGSVLSPQPVNLSGAAAELLRDPPGFDRAEVARADALVVKFFRQHLPQ